LVSISGLNEVGVIQFSFSVLGSDKGGCGNSIMVLVSI
jgi:hypothetical protein